MAQHINQSIPTTSLDGVSEPSYQSQIKSPDQNNSDPEPTTRLGAIQPYTDLVLEFLANASNETLASCLVGLGAVTYFILGRLGLVLIGAVGGVVLHATWEYHGQGHETSRAAELKRRREVGLDVVSRVLDWRHSEDNGQDRVASAEAAVELSSQSLADYSDFKPATRAALENVTDAIVQDYVKYEYRLSSDQQSLIRLDGGTPLSYLLMKLFPPLADKYLSVSSLLSLHIYPENGRLILSSTFSPILLPS